MALVIPSYTTTAHEEAGLQWASDKWNARQLAKEPPQPTKTVLQFWLMVARTQVNQWYTQSIESAADATKLATVAANPPDYTPPPE